MRRTASLAARLATVLLAMAATPGMATDIGSVAAVNTDVTGTPPTAAKRFLNITDDVVLDEQIISSETGNAQLLFLDQTSLTVSPKSEIVLDRYVYDPGQGAGDIAVGMTKGVLRFIGGRITKNSEATVRTPITTIGIRGGIMLLVVSDNMVRVVHTAGDYTRASCDEVDIVQGAAGHRFPPERDHRDPSRRGAAVCRNRLAATDRRNLQRIAGRRRRRRR